VAVTQIDLDDGALAEVMRRSGLVTKKDAVNEALRNYAASRRGRPASYLQSAADRALPVRATSPSSRR
jgi:Arc/MetJ family transcription regulator